MHSGMEKSLTVALLLIPLLWAGGCGKNQKVYFSGMEEQTAAPLTEADAQPQAAEAYEIRDASEPVQQVTEPAREAYVYVCGAVVRPGVYPITEGMRMFEAIELAGGFTEAADEQWLNQAEILHDGQRLYVYTREETQQMAWTEAAGAGTGLGEADSGKINLNTATREELMTLPGIGEAKADAVLSYREEHGAFGSIEEIQNIPGIKSAVFSKIKDQITV